MFKYLRYGFSILGLLLVTGVTNANTNTQELCPDGSSLESCPVTFTAIPSFTPPLCITQVGTFLYTIKNNAPVDIALEYIRIKINDSLPVTTTSIVAAPVPNCVSGGVLGAGKSCNILVSIQPTVAGLLNRELQIGIEGGQAPLVSPIQFTVCGTPPPPPPGGLTYGPALTTPIGCEILAAPTITNTGPSAVNGDVCTSTGVLPASITGFTFSTPPGAGVVTNGGPFGSGAGPTTQAQTSFNTITSYINTVVVPGGCVDLTGMNLGGLTLTPGCYSFSSSALLSGVNPILTLNGAGFYYFITGSTLTTATASSVVLEGGATAGQVYWEIGSSATLGTGTVFNGNLLADVAITFNTGASISGVAWTNGPSAAAVTLDTNVAAPAP